MKVYPMHYRTHNPCEESHWVSRLRENLKSGSDVEGQETGQLVPRLSFTRQLFFKWIKQHLKVKSFYGQSENAVKTQIWIAISSYVIFAIAKKRLELQHSLYEILQLIRLAPFERTHIKNLFENVEYQDVKEQIHNQLKIF